MAGEPQAPDGATTFEGLERALEAGLLGKVGFTGSTEVGRRIGELCGRHLQSPCLELGGKNPLVVMADADLDLAVEGALFSGFGTAGQRCTSLGTVLVHESSTTTSWPASPPRPRSAPTSTSAWRLTPTGSFRHRQGMTGVLLTRDRALDHGRVVSCACLQARRSPLAA